MRDISLQGQKRKYGERQVVGQREIRTGQRSEEEKKRQEGSEAQTNSEGENWGGGRTDDLMMVRLQRDRKKCYEKDKRTTEETATLPC